MKFVLLSIVIFASAVAADVTRFSTGGLQLTVVRGDSFSPARLSGVTVPPTARKSKQFVAENRVLLQNVSSSPIVVPIYPATAPVQPRMWSSKEEEYVFLFDLEVAIDGSTLIRPDTFVRLQPKESVSLAIFGTTADRGESTPKVTVVYEVSKAYGRRHECWSGRLSVALSPKVLYPEGKSPNKEGWSQPLIHEER